MYLEQCNSDICLTDIHFHTVAGNSIMSYIWKITSRNISSVNIA